MCNYLPRFKSSLAEIVKPLKRANTPQRSMVVALAAWPSLQRSQTCNCKCHELEVFWWEQTMCVTGRCQRHWFGTSIFTRGTTCGFHQYHIVCHWNKLLKKFGHQGSMCYVLPVPVWQQKVAVHSDYLPLKTIFKESLSSAPSTCSAWCFCFNHSSLQCCIKRANTSTWKILCKERLWSSLYPWAPKRNTLAILKSCSEQSSSP